MILQYPKITSKTQKGQLEEIRSYLFQLVEQLNTASRGSGSAESTEEIRENAVGTMQTQAETPVGSFNKIKSLIIKSADIVNAYYEQISKRLEGIYVAESDFGIYQEQTAQEITANTTSIDQMYTDLQQIVSNLEEIGNEVMQVSANIRTGLLFYMGADGAEQAAGITEGTPVYGVEVGQRTEVDGEEVFNKFARFTAYGVIFYDENGLETYYIKDGKLNITHEKILGSRTMGGFVDEVDENGGIVTRWVGV